MAHGLDPPTPFASVEAPPSRVVVPSVDHGLVLRPRPTLLAPSVLGHQNDVGPHPPQKPLAASVSLRTMAGLVEARFLLVFAGPWCRGVLDAFR